MSNASRELIRQMHDVEAELRAANSEQVRVLTAEEIDAIRSEITPPVVGAHWFGASGRL